MGCSAMIFHEDFIVREACQHHLKIYDSFDNANTSLSLPAQAAWYVKSDKEFTDAESIRNFLYE